MRAPPPPTPVDEVLAELREAFYTHCPLTFGVHVKGREMFWRDAITGECGHLSREACVPLVEEVLVELARLRAAVRLRKPVQVERRVPWHTASERRRQAGMRR